MLSPAPRLFDLSNLRSVHHVDLTRIFEDSQAETSWRSAEQTLRTCTIPDGTGGVNPGDRRAIFYLVHQLHARSVLEMGTHVGAATIHAAAALRAVALEAGESLTSLEKIRLDTVDVRDVNDIATVPWLNYGTPLSPQEMLARLQLGHVVNFEVMTSMQYLAQCTRRYDLIFLDGNHDEQVVYEEVSAALGLLKRDGVILLHDYFPNGGPLWSNGSIIPGPHAAVQRMQQEGVLARGLPLGRLPWPTKCDSNITSLAILTTRD